MNGFPLTAANSAVSGGKPTKSRQELSEIILARLRPHPQGHALRVIIAPVAKPNGVGPNWRLAFTTRSRRAVPSVAWEIGNKVVDEFDLA